MWVSILNYNVGDVDIYELNESDDFDIEAWLSENYNLDEIVYLETQLPPRINLNPKTV